MIRLGTNLHRFREAGSTGGKEHKLLESEAVVGVRATVDHIESWAGEDEWRLDASKVGEVTVKRDILSVEESTINIQPVNKASLGKGSVVTYFLAGTSLSDGNRNTEDGVGTKVTLVWCTIKLDEEVVNILLLCNLEAGFDKLGGNNIVDIGNSFRYTW